MESPARRDSIAGSQRGYRPAQFVSPIGGGACRIGRPVQSRADGAELVSASDGTDDIEEDGVERRASRTGFVAVKGLNGASVDVDCLKSLL